jgi:Tol biopolymer transport system component
VWSPDGTQIALAVRADASPDVTWRIEVLDIATGGLRALAALPASEGAPPKITWNEAGTHIVVQWPGPSGV